MNKTIAIIVMLVVVVAGIFWFMSQGSSTTPITTPIPTNTITNNPAPTTQASSNMAVSLKNFAFSPSTLVVKVGTTVTWTNNDSVSHTITSDSGNLLASPTLAPGQSFSFTFSALGSVSYHCSIHPMMKGTISVTN